MKLRRLDELPELLRGKNVVLADGCFDIFHVGDIRYLKNARELGDTLVVALSSDSSVRRSKGAGRPIMSEKERVAMISALRSVDHIVVFDEPDVSHVLEVLKPAIHAKHENDSTREIILGIVEKQAK